mgnify:FL=1
MGIEIINGAFDVYTAAIDTAYEDIATDSVVGWDKIGTNSTRHYGEEGVVLSANQEMQKHFFAGGTEVLKISRSQEEVIYSFTLFDLVSAQFVKAFNLATSTTDVAPGSGTGGYQHWDLLRGLTVNGLALLIRGTNKSPDLVTENVQIEVPHVVQIASLEIVHNKADDAGLKFELQAVADYTYNSGNSPYGRILIGDDPAV